MAGGGSGQSTRRINITNLEKNADDGRLLVVDTKIHGLVKVPNISFSTSTNFHRVVRRRTNY